MCLCVWTTCLLHSLGAVDIRTEQSQVGVQRGETVHDHSNNVSLLDGVNAMEEGKQGDSVVTFHFSEITREKLPHGV